MSARPKIVLLGMMTKIPVGGVAWLVGQYALGFQRLGFDVFYVEAHGRTPTMFRDQPHDDPTQQAVQYIATVARRFGLEHQWAFHALHDTGQVFGMSDGELARLYRDAALVINLHGGTKPLPEHARTGRLVYLGTDPVETELEIARGDRRALDFLEPHVAFFTWGLNYGNPDCSLPWSDAHAFSPTPPPIVMDLWENDVDPAGAPLTTIGNWRQEWRDVEYRGERYHWSKHHEFLKVLELPARVSVPLELALGSYEPEDRRLLEQHGWRVRPALDVSSDLDSYRDYLVGSRGELTVAKDQNVRLRTGWFSERSAAYLAAGRPVVMQDTGFGNTIPAGEGLLAFDDLDSAAAAVESVVGDPDRHQRAATELARAHLDTRVVLPTLLDTVGVDIPDRPARRVRPSVDLPRSLRITPRSRRPLELPASTVAEVLARPVPQAALASPRRPTASVVVATVDNLVFARLTLESVLANTWDPSFELIVVDNGSTDGTGEYLSVLSARNPNVRVIRNAENLGFAAAANQGMTAAHGRVIVLLNDDTIVTPGWLRRLEGHLADPTIGLLVPTTNRCGNEAEVRASYDTYGELLDFAAQRPEQLDGDPVFDLPVAVMFCAAGRREILAAVGLLDERFELGMFEDDDYSRRVRAAGFRVACAEFAFVHHFGEATLGRLAADGEYGRVFDANRRRFEEKWGRPWQPHDRRTDPEYVVVRRRLRASVARHVPPGSVVLVISRGDDALVDLTNSEGWHFPRTADGTYAGHYPADDVDAIAQLETLRERGAEYLVVPETSMWWLEHYREFRRHLDDRYRLAARVPETAVIYALERYDARIAREGSLA